MNIEQVNEALARIGNGDKSHKIQDTLIAVAAARRFVDGWETCPTCNGSRLTHDDCRPIGRTMCQTCPDCVDGMTPGPQLVERVATILADHDTMDWQDDPDTYLPLAKAVLLASRREEQ